jgi:hypothetical protein
MHKIINFKYRQVPTHAVHSRYHHLERKFQAMAGSWDSQLKMLVAIAPQDIISWLLTGARLESELSPHLPGRNIDADILYQVNIDNHTCLLHIEFQRLGNYEMAKRVWEYNVLRKPLLQKSPIP